MMSRNSTEGGGGRREGSQRGSRVSNRLSVAHAQTTQGGLSELDLAEAVAESVALRMQEQFSQMRLQEQLSEMREKMEAMAAKLDHLQTATASSTPRHRAQQGAAHQDAAREGDATGDIQLRDFEKVGLAVDGNGPPDVHTGGGDGGSSPKSRQEHSSPLIRAPTFASMPYGISFLVELTASHHEINPSRKGYLGHVDWLYEIVSSWKFHMLTLVVIALNTMSIILAIDHTAAADYGPEHNDLGPPGPAERFLVPFALFYTAELGTRLLVHGRDLYKQENTDCVWNWIDLFSLLGVYADVLSMWGLIPWFDLALAPRMLRITRIFWVFRFLPEVYYMMMCLQRSVSTLFLAAVLLGFALIVPAIFLTQWMAQFRWENPEQSDNPEILRYFSSVEQTIIMLFQAVSGGIVWGEFFDVVLLAGDKAAGFLIFWILSMHLCIFNIVVSHYVNRSMETANLMNALTRSAAKTKAVMGL